MAHIIDMLCLYCESEEFVLRPAAEIEQEFRGETLWVTTPAMACRKCGWLTFGKGQIDELRRRTAKSYQALKRVDFNKS